MPKSKKVNIKNIAVKELNQITDLVDLDMVNTTLKANGINKIDISKKTLMNIGKWALNGSSEFEIKNNLELTEQEWRYLLKTCPAIVIVMQHSYTFADMMVAGTLFQTAIGGKITKKKVPMKIKDYDNGVIIGEHIEYVEVEEEAPANAMLLKFLAENKLSDNFSDKKKSNSMEHKDFLETLTAEQIKAIEEYKKSNR